jgi:hypothetical protein
MFVDANACKDNIRTMDPNNWYISEENTFKIVQEKIKGKRFLHMRFELPHPAPSYKKDFIDSDDVLCVDIDSDLAKIIFRQDLIDEYVDFVNRELEKRRADTLLASSKTSAH